MKIAPADADRFVDKPDPAVRAVLIYGPDRGLADERAARLARAVVDTPNDPFRVAELSGGAVTADPARLFDEVAAQCLTGGRRLVHVRGAGNEHAALFERMLASAVGDALVIVEGSDLGPRARLRTAFESAANAAAIPCYPDDAASLEKIIAQTLGSYRVTADPPAVAELTRRLGADRRITRGELEKLALFVGDGAEASETDVAACVGDASLATLDDLVDATANGDHGSAHRALARLHVDGANPVTIIRSLQRHFQRLQLAAAARGRSRGDALAALKPPVFFKRRRAFVAALDKWPPTQLASALDLLLEAELACKSSGAPASVLCAYTVLRVTEAARRNGAASKNARGRAL